MAEPITAKYVQENDDWAITVSGGEKQLTGRAPGIIAARDSVDQLVEQLGADFKGATVVHLLNGSALDFTAAYMTARLTLPEVGPLEIPAPTAAEKAVDNAIDKAIDKAEKAAEAKVEPADEEPAEKAESVPEQAQAPEQAAKPQNKASRRPKAKLTADIGDALESPVNTKLPTVTGSVSVVTVPSARA